MIIENILAHNVPPPCDERGCEAAPVSTENNTTYMVERSLLSAARLAYRRLLCALHLPSQEVETLAEVAWRFNSFINARFCPATQLPETFLERFLHTFAKNTNVINSVFVSTVLRL